MDTKAVRFAVPCLFLAIGVLLTAGLFTAYRPWGPTRLDGLVLLGPFVLAAGTALAIPKSKERHASSGGLFLGVGLLLLLVGGCPWTYTPLFTGGSNSSSGMMGTLIFIVIGLPGLALTAVGFGRRRTERRSIRHDDLL